MTRTNISITKPITWNAGDRLFAYNITSPRSDYDYLSVASDGFYSKFVGDIHWSDGDELAMFYPYIYEKRDSRMGVITLGLEENTVMDQGEAKKGHQNGTLENLRFFDYSWTKIKNIQSTGVNALANVIFEKQYSLVGFSVRYKGEPVKKIKRVTLNNVLH